MLVNVLLMYLVLWSEKKLSNIWKELKSIDKKNISNSVVFAHNFPLPHVFAWESRRQTWRGCATPSTG